MKHGYLEMNKNYPEGWFIMHKQDLKVIEIFVQISIILGPIIQGMFGLWQTIYMISPLHW
jgi:hypothetical protein